LAGAVLAQVAIKLPGNVGEGTPSWQQPDQSVRTLYVTSFDMAGDVLPATVVAAQNRAGEMVKASALADNVQFIEDVGTKTIIDATNPYYGQATVELALPAVHDVMVDLVFTAPGRIEAIIHGQTVTLSGTAPGGVAVAHPACPGDGDCCDPAGNGTPGCDDVDCCNLICDQIDSFCCDVFWDGLCASSALANCAVCVLPGCPLDCPPGALDEGEPCLVDGDTDVTNGGCNSTPPVFTAASCNDTFCGTISTYVVAGGDNRDTDWYMINHPGGTISATLTSQFPGVCFIVDGVGPGGNPCAPAVVGNIGCSSDCANIQVASASLPAGTVVVFVSSGDCAGGGIFAGLPCGSSNDYVVEIACEGPCQTDDDCPPGQICVDGICIIPPPTNDDCNDAVALDVGSGGSVDISGTTINATVDPVECVTSTTAPGVWYSVIGTGNTMTASTCNQADYDTKISIFCGTCPTGGGSDCCVANGTPGCDDPTCEAIVCAVDPFCCDVAWDSICAGEAQTMCEICMGPSDFVCVDGLDDSSGCGLTTELSWCSEPAAVYYILVHGFSSATGNFTLTVSDNGMACSGAVDCPAVCQSDDDCPPGFICVDGECIEVPTGACCQCDGPTLFCTIETEADCMALDGLYLGDGEGCEAGGGDEETYTSSPGLAIPDDAAPAGVSDTITVGDSFNVLDIKVALNISHTWVGDLCVLLSKDGGPDVVLMQRINDATGLACDGEGCCGCSSDNVDCTLWDGAADAVNDQCGWSGALTGTYYSESFNLSTFAGGDSAGDWTITVNDGAAGDTGTLNSWSLILTAPGSGLSPCEEAGFSCNEPPDCSMAYASVGELWPPNHKLDTVTIEGVVDPDGDPVTITITGISQDEETDGLGDGNTCPDAFGVGTDTAELRAERSGLGDGRVYHIAFTADDGQGGTCSGTVTVCVPHDQAGDDCVDQGPLYDSTDCGGMAASFNEPAFGAPGE
jgi:subtilisin-like proprotein convertase family protein